MKQWRSHLSLLKRSIASDIYTNGRNGTRKVSSYFFRVTTRINNYRTNGWLKKPAITMTDCTTRGSFGFFGSWWRHQMETFSALLAICAGNSSVPGEFPAQRPVTRSFDVFFDLRLNKRLSKQSWGWWFETLSCPLWRHRNVLAFHPRTTDICLKMVHR